MQSPAATLMRARAAEMTAKEKKRDGLCLRRRHPCSPRAETRYSAVSSLQETSCDQHALKAAGTTCLQDKLQERSQVWQMQGC